ncbi:glycosyltransferase family 2 protein [Mesobacterium pallidum]|uniref:glycosyltransferase family 2 protein n=1 Tax=Mesobacterium pallidum TaxID=2872037 RepID=UPI001EE21A42|nr:glycosyltransferase family 2 protein [Mesobacterium pallidum]
MSKKPEIKAEPATEADTVPALSVIVTAYNEGEMAALSLNSILAQTFTDFEILLVDDGASEATRTVLRSFDDPRITHIRQSNDGPSSARNRALNVATGDYICFLDSDDTRPPWAFETMMAATENQPDVVFSRGMLSELRNEVLPFYDTHAFNALARMGITEMASDHRDYLKALRHLACLEPQSANKCIRREFIKTHHLRFPNGLSMFEDSNFHMGVLMNMERFALTELPTFTYFRRYGEPRLTDGRSTTRFDAIGSVANVLHLFSHSSYFHDAVLRKLVLATCFRVLQWSEESISLDLKYSYRQALRSLIGSVPRRYLAPLDDAMRPLAYAHAPWVEPTLRYVDTLV